jgi:hypothetical protein
MFSLVHSDVLSLHVTDLLLKYQTQQEFGNHKTTYNGDHIFDTPDAVSNSLSVPAYFINLFNQGFLVIWCHTGSSLDRTKSGVARRASERAAAAFPAY